MPGNHLYYKLSLVITLLAGILFLPARPALTSSPGGPIAILLSDSSEAYRQQADSFTQESDLPCQVFNLKGDILADPGLKDRLLAGRPPLIYALGAKAAYAAKLWTKERQEIPVIFAMVLNWKRYNLMEGNDNIVGIAAETAPGTQFANMTMLSPATKRIGLIYSPYSTALVRQAEKDAALLGLELIAEPINNSEDFQLGFKKLSGRIDAFWVLNDPVLYTLENIDWLENRCLKEKIFCVGQSKNLAARGITLSINPDSEQIAAQASAIAKNILANRQHPNELQVMDPLGTQLVLNSKTAKLIGLTLSPQALDLATTIVDQ